MLAAWVLTASDFRISAREGSSGRDARLPRHFAARGRGDICASVARTHHCLALEAPGAVQGGGGGREGGAGRLPVPAFRGRSPPSTDRRHVGGDPASFSSAAAVSEGCSPVSRIRTPEGAP